MRRVKFIPSCFNYSSNKLIPIINGIKIAYITVNSLLFTFGSVVRDIKTHCGNVN